MGLFVVCLFSSVLIPLNSFFFNSNYHVANALELFLEQTGNVYQHEEYRRALRGALWLEIQQGIHWKTDPAQFWCWELKF